MSNGINSEQPSVINKLISGYFLNVDNDIHNDSLQLQNDVTDLVFEENWDKLLRVTRLMRGKSILTFNWLKERSFRFGIINSIIEGRSGTAKDLLSNLEENLKDPLFREKLENEFSEDGEPSKIIDDFLKRLEKNPKKKLFSLESPVHSQLEFFITIGYLAYWGGFHAMFNQHIKKIPPHQFTETELQELKILIEFQQKEIMADFIKIQSALAQGSNVTIFTSEEIILKQEASLEFLAISCGILTKATEHALKNEQNKSANILGSMNLLAGHTARLWILLVLACHYVMRLGFLTESDLEFRKAASAALKLPFKSAIKDGKNVTIRDLVTNGLEFDEKFVEVTGFVRDLKTDRTDDGKFISHFNLFEAGKEESIPIFAIFENLRGHGLANGCFVRINGLWKQESNIVDFPALQIERIKLSQLKEESWFDRLIVAVRSLLDFYPNSHFITWSISQQQKDETNLSNTLAGASELILGFPELKDGGL